MIVHSTHAFLGIIHFISLVCTRHTNNGRRFYIGDLYIINSHYHSGGIQYALFFSHLGANQTAISILAYEPVLVIIAISAFMLTGSFDISALYAMRSSSAFKMPLAFVALLLILPVKLKNHPSMWVKHTRRWLVV